MEDVVVLSSSAAAAAARHSCKVCGKGFPCGRSLGGHMRSHSVADVAAADDEDEDGDEERQGRRWTQSGSRVCNGVVHGAGGGGYGLRENPRKTRRLSGSASDEDDGAGDDDDDGGDECLDRGELLSSSCRSVFGHVRRHALGGGGYANGDDVSVKVEEGPEEDEEGVSIPTEEVTVMAAPAPAPRRRRSMRVPAPAPAPPPERDAFDKEPVEEDVAHCLIMLSRDTPWAAEFSPEKYRRTTKRENLARNGYRHDADSDDNSGLLPQNAVTDAELTGSRKRKLTAPAGTAVAPAKRSQYECPGCGRAFQSYQALGGHRASHKRINSDCCLAKAAADQPPKPTSSTPPSTPASPDADVDDKAAAAAMKARTTKAAAKFECPICLKVFGSGQALGGHKRSHSIAGELYDHGDVVAADKEPPLIPARFLNLNLPAPGADD